MVEFWLSESLFSRTFLFSRWNSDYQEAFLTNFFFFTMEFWLSGSLSHEPFLFHDGILAIRQPFSRTFSFSRWNSGYQEAFLTNFFFFQEAFLTNFFFFTMEFWLSGSLSHEIFLFHDGILEIRDLGKTLFIYISQRVFT
jgi:hypothetical protein